MLSESSRVTTMMRRAACFFGFVPSPPRVDFDAGVGVDRNQRRLDGAQRADHLTDQVGIAGGVDNIEVLAGVIEVRDRRFDRVLVMLLFFVEVADASSRIDVGLGADSATFDQQVID